MILLDGSLPALLAAAMWHEGRLLAGDSNSDSGMAWLLGTARMQRAAERIADAFGLAVVARSDGVSDRIGEPVPSIVVLAGATGAARMGCERLLWPVHAGGAESPDALDLDIIAEAIDRATLIGRLASLDGRNEIEVSTPFVDFSDRQIADLVLDMGLDPGACWWAEADVRSDEADDAGERTADALAHRRRWQIALREAGMTV